MWSSLRKVKFLQISGVAYSYDVLLCNHHHVLLILAVCLSRYFGLGRMLLRVCDVEKYVLILDTQVLSR